MEKTCAAPCEDARLHVFCTLRCAAYTESLKITPQAGLQIMPPAAGQTRSQSVALWDDVYMHRVRTQTFWYMRGCMFRIGADARLRVFMLV